MLYAQSGQYILFTKLWQVTNGSPDSIAWTSTRKDKMKNFITCGNTLSTNGFSDILISKYNQDGELLWQITFDGPNHYQDYGVKVVTDDSLKIYIAAATYYSITNNFDYNIIKLDADGNTIWQTYYNSSSSNYDIPTAITIDPNCNVYVTGVSYNDTTLSDYLTLKLDSVGTMIWHKKYDYSNMNEMPVEISYDGGGRVHVVGASGNSFNDYDIATVSHSASNGYQGYINRTGGSGLGYDKPTSMCADQLGNLYITGAIFESSQYDIKVIKLDTALNIVWQDTFDLIGFDDIGYSIKLDQDGFVYIAGTASLSDEVQSGVLLKYSNSGTLLWSKYAYEYDEHISEYKSLFIQQDGLVFAGGSIMGSVDRDILVHAYNQGGKLKGTLQHKGLYKGNDVTVSITAVKNRIAIHGLVANSDTTSTYMTIEYQLDTILQASNLYDDIGSSAAFWENRGQLITNADSLASGIKYYTQSGYALYFTDSSYSYVLARAAIDSTVSDTLWRVEVTYPGAKQLHTTAYGKPKPDYLNYYLAHCPNGVVNVTGYNTLLCPNISRNIDIEYRWFNNQFAPRIVVKPGGSPGDILMKFNGADSITIASDSSLLIHTGIGKIKLPKLIVYESDEEGGITPISWPGMYIVYDSITAGLFFDSYDSNKYLVYSMEKGGQIGNCPDYNLIWSTYYNSDNAYMTQSDYDEDGNVYFTGTYFNGWYQYYIGAVGPYYWLTNSPISNASLIFSQCYSPYNKLKYSSVIGGSSFDTSYDIKIAGNDESIFIVGKTQSWNFPNVNINGLSSTYMQSQKGIDEDCFILRMKKSGTSLIWSTFFGGDHPNESFYKIICKDDRLFVVGQGGTNSVLQEHELIPTAYFSSEGTGLLCEFTTDGNLVWSTTIGDETTVAKCLGIAYIDFTNELMIVGETSGGLPLEGTSAFLDHIYNGGISDLFAMTFDNNLSLIMTTYIGGDGNDLLNSSCKKEVFETKYGIYIVGNTNSTNYPVVSSGSAYSEYYHSLIDGIITLIDHYGFIDWSTYWGGANDDFIYDITTDNKENGFNENLYIVGKTNSLDMNCYNSLPSYYWWNNETTIINTRGLLCKFNQNHQLLLSSYFYGDAASSNIISYNSLNTTIAFNENLYVGGSSNSIIDFPFCYAQDSYYFDNGPTDEFPKSPCVARFLQSPPNNTSVEIVSSSNISAILFPNPNNGTVIHIDSTISIKTIFIKNILGMEIYTSNTDENTISGLNLMPGLYLVTVIDESGNMYNTKLTIL